MKNRFASLTRRAATLGLIALALPALATAAPLPGDNFEADDGNLVVNTGGNVDWNTASPEVAGDLPQASDNNFTIGSQEDNPASTWGITNSPVNSKADITRVYTKSSFPFFRLGIVRNQAANGTVAFHVELNQSNAKHANGLPVRTVGDALFVYDVHGNDTTATIMVHRWVAAGQCVTNTGTPCWGPGTTLNATQAIGANHVGPGTTLDTVADPNEQLAAKTFDELAVNLAAVLGVPENTCVNFGQVWVKTREGAAFGSALQDLMGPMPIHLGNCDVAIEKDVVAVNGGSVLNPASVVFNSQLEYRIRVFLGPVSVPVPASLLTVTDTTVSDGTLSNAPLVPVMAAGQIVGDDGDELLEQGEKWVYALSPAGTPVVQAATTCPDVVNSTRVVVTGGDTNPANDQATRTTPVVCNPDLVIDKSGPASVAFDGTIIYAITVRHTDTSDPLGIPVQSVSDKIGAGASVPLTLLSGDDGDGLLEKGEVWTYGLQGGPLTHTPTTCADVVNVVTLSAAGDTNAANNTDSVTTKVLCNAVIVGALDTRIAIRKVGPKSGQVKRAVAYTILVTNTGPAIARNVVVVDPVPAGMVIAKRPANATFSKGKVTWRVGDLPPGQSVALRLLLRTDVNVTATRCNVATASASNAPSVRGRACTRFARIVAAAVVPRVTG